MDRIQKVSGSLVLVLNALAVLIPLGICLRWLCVDSSFIQSLMSSGVLGDFVVTPEGIISLLGIEWSPASKILVTFANIVDALPLIGGLLLLRLVFRNYQNGAIFTVENARHYKRLGVLFFVSAFVTQPIAHTVETLGLTLLNEPGHRYLSLSFGTPNLWMLFCGACIMVISWVMQEASRMEGELQLTV